VISECVCVCVCVCACMYAFMCACACARVRVRVCVFSAMMLEVQYSEHFLGLDLSGNMIADAGIAAIAEMLCVLYIVYTLIF